MQANRPSKCQAISKCSCGELLYEHIVVSHLNQGHTASPLTQSYQVDELLRMISHQKQEVIQLSTLIVSEVERVTSEQLALLEQLKSDLLDSQSNIASTIQRVSQVRSRDTFEQLINQLQALNNQTLESYEQKKTSKRSQIYSRNVIYAQNFPNHIVNVVRGKFATPDGELEVAVKEYLSSTPGYVSKFKGEINIIKKFSGIKECFLKYYGDYLTQEEDKEVLGIVMEYCPYQFIDDITLRGQEGRYYTEQEIYIIAHQLAEGFSQLHEQKLAHKDIKPHNIFISKEGYIKIADFNISEQGVSTTQVNATGIFKVQGTDGYMAPELQYAYLTQKASNQKTNVRYKPLKADVYSLGLTILQVYTLQNVKGYNTESRQGELTQIINSIPYSWLREFLSRALQFEYKNRPKMKELLMYLNFKDTTGVTHANY